MSTTQIVPQEVPTIHLQAVYGSAARELDELFRAWTAADRRADGAGYGDPVLNARAGVAWRRYRRARDVAEVDTIAASLATRLEVLEAAR